MAAAGWFAMSVHSLALLSQSKDGFPSSYIAGSVNTNAVFLRRVLKKLVEVGLIETKEGREGGYRLTRPAEQITLAEIYESLGLDKALALSPAEPNAACPVGAGITSVMEQVSEEAHEAMMASLRNYTIAQVARMAVTK
ncbi:Rrf2 family transcriptional regulator [Paenibacillus senegalensis]|uniref:Rrf2 family transcriptional regulator n=1 Tax=Paenibacillus senegalensis TaxID=1465766 RepID=UPI000289A419|nr:Rrf2 family transcriptional regulator [Paenibacillus senegalensis]